MDNGIPIIGSAKKKFCETCGERAHPFTTQCRYQTLVHRIHQLLTANRTIPSMLEMNKEATAIALKFENMFKKSGQALTLVEKVVMEHPDGPQIWTEFQKRLEDLWPAETSSQGTEENQPPSSPENTTPSESESKPCTGETTGGGTTAPAS